MSDMNRNQTVCLMLLSNPFAHDARVYNEARSLNCNGYEVIIIGMKCADLKSFENKNNIKIIRTGCDKFDLIPIIKLLIWYISIVKLLITEKIYKNIKIIHCHDLDTLPIAVLLKFIVRKPLIYDSHEMFHYTLIERYPSIVSRIACMVEKKLIGTVNCVITVNIPLRNHFLAIKAKRVIIIENCKFEELPGIETERNTGLLTYVGRIEPNRYIKEICLAVEEIGLRIIVAGDGEQDYINELINLIKPNVLNINGELSIEEAKKLVQKSYLIIRLSNPSNLNDKIGLPNKIFESMSYGIPIIVTKNTYCGEFVESNKIGLTCENSITDIKLKILTLLKDEELYKKCVENGIFLSINRYNWNIKEKELIGLYHDLLVE